MSAAVLIALNSAVNYSFLAAKTGQGLYNKIALYCSLGSSIGLAILVCCNEKEDGRIHGIASVVFFVLYEVYMIIVTLRLLSTRWAGATQAQQYRALPASVGTKIVCTCISFVSLVLFVIWSGHWSKHHIGIAVCEWVGVMCIQVFNLSCWMEFTDAFGIATVLRDGVDGRGAYAPLGKRSLPALFYATPAAK